MKRIISIALMLTMLLCALPALGGVLAADEVVTLRFAPNWGSDDSSALQRKMIDAWLAENPDIKLEFEEISGDEMKNKIRVDVAANNEPDVWQFWPGCVIKEYAAAGVLANVDEYMAKSSVVSADHFSDTVWSPCTIGGQRVAMPRMGASAVMLVNSELFEQYGLEYPVTWDDFLAVGKVFRENGITPINVGSKLGNPSHFFYNELVCQYTDGVQDVINLLDDSTLTFTTPAMEKAAVLIQEARDAGMFAEDTLGQTGDWAPATAYYMEGKSAMCYTLSWEYRSFTEDMLAKSVIIPFPQLSDTDRDDKHIQGTTNDCWCISARAWADPAKQDAITRFMDFILGDLTLETARNGYIITVDNTLSPQIPYEEIDTELMSRVLIWREENDIQADPMIWQSLPTLAVQTDYCNALDELWAGAISADEYIAKVQASIDDYLE